MLPAPTKAELALFTGRPENTFGPYADQALAQAALMFTIVTHLDAYPASPDLQQMARYAILEMADRLVLEQPWQAYLKGPFQSETIGSWSYSKLTQTTRAVQQGTKTGLFWWDLAVDQLRVPGDSSAAHGSIAVTWDGLLESDDGMVIAEPDGDDDASAPYTRMS